MKRQPVCSISDDSKFSMLSQALYIVTSLKSLLDFFIGKHKVNNMP